MLAMRDGQPCLVHGVGGLKDTVSNNETGFVFNGESLGQQVENLTETFEKALKFLSTNESRYNDISRNASSARFEWQGLAQEYISKLYN